MAGGGTADLGLVGANDPRGIRGGDPLGPQLRREPNRMADLWWQPTSARLAHHGSPCGDWIRLLATLLLGSGAALSRGTGIYWSNAWKCSLGSTLKSTRKHFSQGNFEIHTKPGPALHELLSKGGIGPGPTHVPRMSCSRCVGPSLSSPWRGGLKAGDVHFETRYWQVQAADSDVPKALLRTSAHFWVDLPSLSSFPRIALT